MKKALQDMDETRYRHWHLEIADQIQRHDNVLQNDPQAGVRLGFHIAPEPVVGRVGGERYVLQNVAFPVRRALLTMIFKQVKCDEAHPRCGPCTRLNRECDWDHRWNFNDSVQVVQNKYSNVTTSGNSVWDPAVSASSSPLPQEDDDLPDFASLTTDEERERKAVTQRPGTFAVVATPESFYDLPEYAAVAPASHRRTSGTSFRGGHGSPMSNLTRSRTLPDPNTVVLDRFEDSLTSPVGTFTISTSTGSRRGSFPENLEQLSITTPPYASSTASAPPTPVRRPDEHLLVHFRQYIAPRLIQPQQGLLSPGSTQDVLGMEAVRFPPLHHAICAVSALGLAYNGRASMEESMQHYHQALAAQSTATSPNDLILDGVFLRHFLLLVYDICIPMQADDSSADSLWAGHLNHLRHIAIQRHRSRGREPHGHILWTICELDMYACLMGSGNCDFVQTIMSHNMLPPLEQQVPSVSTLETPGTIPYFPHEAHAFPPVLHLNEGIVLRTAKLAQIAQTFKSESSGQRPASPGMYARWQATVMQLQAEMLSFWQQAYPEQLGPESQAGSGLPSRVRSVFENVSIVLFLTK